MFKYSKAYSGFSVNDLQKAKEFYSKVLGVTVVDNPMGLIELCVGAGSHILVYPKPDHTPATFTILNFHVNNIEETVDQLSSQGVKFEQYGGDIQTDEKGICHSSGGPTIAWFKDPAGNIISIIEQK